MIMKIVIFRSGKIIRVRGRIENCIWGVFIVVGIVEVIFSV